LVVARRKNTTTPFGICGENRSTDFELEAVNGGPQEGYEAEEKNAQASHDLPFLCCCLESASVYYCSTFKVVACAAAWFLLVLAAFLV